MFKELIITKFKGLSFIRLGLSLSLISLALGLLPYAPFLFANESLTQINSSSIEALMRYPTFLVCLFIFSTACFGLGFFPKIATAVSLILFILFLQRNPFFSWGNSQFAIQLLIILLFTQFFSPQLRNPESSQLYDHPKNSFFYLLWALHIPIVYLTTSLSRINSTNWINGNAALYTLLNRSFSFFHDVNFEPLQPFLKVLTWSVIVIELLCVVALLLPKWLGKKILVLSIFMHLGFLLTIHVQNWQSLILVLLIFSYLHFERIQETAQNIIFSKSLRQAAIIILYLGLNVLTILMLNRKVTAIQNVGLFAKGIYFVTGLSGPASLTMFQSPALEREICYSFQIQNEDGSWQPLFGKQIEQCDQELMAWPGNEKNLYFRRLTNWEKIEFKNTEFQKDLTDKVCQIVAKRGLPLNGIRFRQTLTSFMLMKDGSIKTRPPVTTILIDQPCFDPS